MKRNGVGSERVDREDVETPCRFLRQLEPRIANDDPCVGRAIGDETECAIARVAHHERVDLEEGPALSRLAIAGQGADTEAGDADRVAGSRGGQDQARSGSAAVLRRRLIPEAACEPPLPASG